jgi:hypothetical protein
LVAVISVVSCSLYINKIISIKKKKNLRLEHKRRNFGSVVWAPFIVVVWLAGGLREWWWWREKMVVFW